MQQNGDFREEASGQNLINDFLENDWEAKTEAVLEYEYNLLRIQSELVVDSEHKFVRLIVK